MKIMTIMQIYNNKINNAIMQNYKCKAIVIQYNDQIM